ncbi:uncharacterized protein LOC127239400 [Andrographis paniculata]|uniref:uncharacterized protein LOC127239400 n=1 Tax=Andrographis paniculata TaxID=175694 RepID=UPI0021E951E2|nr:uncharacterized protein LOC127239400 [Andrographis paniculata]XP_051113487.1 uncharacterized protein LOC127239400 [Andrographis paniculata]
MPGNEFGDRVHNFFAPDNSSQGQHQSHVLQGNWPVLNNNIWVNGQIQIDPTNSSNNYALQNSDIGRRQTNYSVDAANGLNFSRSDLGPDFCKNQSLNEQPYTNGFVYGDRIYQNGQNESNFLPVNTNSAQHHLLSSSGLAVHGLQQGSCSDQQPKASSRFETSLPFDIFGAQQQISPQQASMMQAIQQQQAGLNDMHHLQQQFLIKKMQDLQRQQQLQQSGLRTQDLMNQNSPLNMSVSGFQSTLVTDSPNSDTMHEHGTSWLSHGSSNMQGSPSGFAFQPSIGQTQPLMDLAPQQAEQSLFGVPVSSSRGLAMNHYSQMEDGSSMPQMPTPSSSQHKFFPNQNGAQDGNYNSSKKIQTENMFGHSVSQSLNSGTRDTGSLQHKVSTQRNAPQQESWGQKVLDTPSETQRNAPQQDSWGQKVLDTPSETQRNAPQQDSWGQKVLDTPSETLHERPPWKAGSSQNEVALDPTEEKILYGSDDNIWNVLGKSSNMSGEAGNLFDNGGLTDEFPSMQSGSWSALMQSAVAETSSSDIAPQEWNGLTFHNAESFPANKPSTISLPKENLQTPSVLNAARIPSSADLNSQNVMGSNQIGHEFQSVPAQRVGNTPFIFGQSLEEASSKKLNPIQKAAAKGSPIHGNASQNSLNAERSTKTVSASWSPRQSGPRDHFSGLKVLEGVPSGGDRVSSIHENEKLQSFQESQSRVIQGEVGHGGSLWNPNSLLSSNTFGHVNPADENHLTNKGVLNLNGTASVEDSSKTGVPPNNFFLNQWKSTHPSSKFHGGEHFGRNLDEVNGNNHGLGSLTGSDKDVALGKDLKTRPQKENSSDSYHSNLTQHASGGHLENRLLDAGDSRSSSLGKQKSINQLSMKDPVHRKFQYHPMGNLDKEEEPAASMKQPTQDMHKKDTRHFSPCTSSKTSSQGQNMLELFQKLDQAGDQVVSSRMRSDYNSPSQLNTTDKNDGSASRSQHAQSSGSQVFGFDLGPPSRRFQASESSSSAPNAPGMGQHGTENSVYKLQRNYNPALSSAIPCGKDELENKQTSEKMVSNQHQSSFGGNALQFMQRGSADNVLSDSSHLQNDDPTSVACNTQHLSNPGISEQDVSRQVLHNMLTKGREPEWTLAAQKKRKAPLCFSDFTHSSIVKSSRQDELSVGKEPNLSSKSSTIHTNFPGVDKDQPRVNIDLDAKMEESGGKVTFFKNQLNDSPANSKDIQAFGRPSKPNEQYALLNQMKVLRDTESDLDVRVSKRIKEADTNVENQVNLMPGQQNEAGVSSSFGLNSEVPSDGFRTLGIPNPFINLQKSTSSHGNVASQDAAMPGMDASKSHLSTNSAASVGAERLVSPQMAPSWFNQYGNLRNGLLPVNNAQQVANLKPAELPYILGKSSNVSSTLISQEKIASAPTPVDARQVDGTILNSSSTSVANEHLPSPLALQLNLTPQHQVIPRPNKRKADTFQLHPWHKEISDHSKALSTLSMAESDWSKAANRRSEKVEDGTELVEDVHPMLKLKRRLVSTTQLMQQMFPPPPANILSSDARSEYESVAYSVSRLGLGDACRSVSFSSDSELPPDGVNLGPAKRKLKPDQLFAQAIDELSGKAKKLESDLSRLEKGISMSDLRVEHQDLEKHSTINRFARVHGRGPNYNAETASANVGPPCVLRYVTAHPMPKNIPDGVQCLPL